MTTEVYLTGGRCTLCRRTSVLNSLKLSAIVRRRSMSVLIVLFMMDSRVDISANEKLCSLQNLLAQENGKDNAISTMLYVTWSVVLKGLDLRVQVHEDAGDDVVLGCTQPCRQLQRRLERTDNLRGLRHVLHLLEQLQREL